MTDAPYVKPCSARDAHGPHWHPVRADRYTPPLGSEPVYVQCVCPGRPA